MPAPKSYQKYTPETDLTDVGHIIVGSGIGGLTAATWLAKAGHKVVVFERHFKLPFLRPETKIKGLRLVGQDILIVGLASAMISGMIAAITILKFRVWKLFRDMNKLDRYCISAVCFCCAEILLPNIVPSV